MKKFCIFTLVIFMLLTIIPVNATTTETTDPSVNTTTQEKTYSCYTLDAVESIIGSKEIVENVDTAVIYEYSSDTMMYALNPDVRVEPASLVKIMTCLIAVEEGVMSDAVTVKEETINSIAADAANVSLKPEEVLTMENLLYCMMINSANDAAAVIADHIAGSQEAFVDKMNAYAMELGCTNTYFTNVHGLYDPRQYTTARDMAKILRRALDNELFKVFFGTEYYTIPETNKSDVRYLLTSNYLLSKEDVEIYYDERVTGGRTGITQDYARSLAVEAKSGNMSIICITTGSDSTVASNGYLISVFGGYQETSKLLDACFDGYYVAQVVYDGQTVTQQPVDNGDCDVVLGSKNTAYAVIPVNTKISDLSYRLVSRDSLVAPIKAGQWMTSVDIWLNDDCVAEAELYAMNDVRVQQEQITDHQVFPNPTTPETVKKSYFWVWIVVGIVIIAIGIIMLPRIVSAYRRSIRKKTTRRNQRNRRKSR